MTDTAEGFDRAAFREAAGLEPVEAPPTVGDTAEEADTAEADGRARDEQGRFAAKEPDAEAPPTDEPAEEPPPLAGKYKTAEELERGYKELEAAYKRQGAEVGELRKLREEFTELRKELGPQAQPSYDPAGIDDHLAANPQQIPALAQQAIDQDDGYLYGRAIAAWQELDPVGAMDFHARQIVAAEVKALREENAPQREALAKVEMTSAFASAYETAKSKHEDFDAVLNGITQDTLDGIPPEVLAGLQTGDQASKERCLETLYRWTKAEQAGALTQAATEAAVEAHQDGQAAKLAAAVATTTGTSDRAPVAGADAYRQAFRDSPEFKKAAGQV